MRKYLKFVALCLLAGLALWWFARGVDWAEVSAALGRADWPLVALAVGIIWLTYLIRALRWKTLLRPLAPRASLREAFAATTVGFTAIFLLGRGGEVVRPAFLPLRDPEVRPGAAFVTIAVERVCDMVAVILFFAANLLFLRMPGADEATAARVREAGLIMSACAVAGLAALVWFGRHADGVTAWLDRRLDRLPRFMQKVGRVFVGLLEQTGQRRACSPKARLASPSSVPSR